MGHVVSEAEDLKSLFADEHCCFSLMKFHSIVKSHLDKLKLITEELEFERSLRSTSDLDNDNARIALHRQAAKNQGEELS